MAAEEEPSKEFLEKLERGWKCILEQCFQLACENSMKEGKGMSIFKFLKRKDNESNCHYFYTKSESSTWDIIISKSPNGKSILEKYDPDSMILICVQIPIDSLFPNEETNGNIKLFYIDSKKEVLIKDKKDDKKSDTGLRKRNIPSN